MSFDPEALASRFTALEGRIGTPSRYVIAFSGGLDSTALAHCVIAMCQQDPQFSARDILLLHVDHGLHTDSAAWSKRCAAFAAAHNTAFRSLAVCVLENAGKGLEAAARDARYSAMRAELRAGDWLLSAHHADDQAETLLLNMLRGSGAAGLAGIAEARPMGPAWLVRPLLSLEQSVIREYAQSTALNWIDDPSNDERRFDRNFLRHEVLPIMARRWPDVAQRLQRSAAYAGEASELMQDLARADLQTLGGRATKLPLDGLSRLSTARQKNLIRFALRDLRLPAPTAVSLERVLNEVIAARVDAQPEVCWPGAVVRRYRNTLYLMPELPADAPLEMPFSGRSQSLPAGCGTLKLSHDGEPGLSESVLNAGLVIRSRGGGEEIKPFGQPHTRKLKKLLQEEGVVPWMRDRLPLLYSDGRLVAVADLWLADDAVSTPGASVHWIDRPALH